MTKLTGIATLLPDFKLQAVMDCTTHTSTFAARRNLGSLKKLPVSPSIMFFIYFNIHPLKVNVLSPTMLKHGILITEEGGELATAHMISSFFRKWLLRRWDLRSGNKKSNAANSAE